MEGTKKAEVIKITNCMKQPHSGPWRTKGKRSELSESGSSEEGPHRIRIQPPRRGHCLAIAGISR